jgi:hypothetical protein
MKSIRTKYLVASLTALAAVAAFAQAPAQKPVARPPLPTPTAPDSADTGTVPAIDSASAAILGPLATQRQALATQLKTLIAQYNSVNSQWRIAEGKALANAGIDPGVYGVDPTGTNFIKRVGPPSRN